MSGQPRPDYHPMSGGAFAYRSDDHFLTWTQERVDRLSARGACRVLPELVDDERLHVLAGDLVRGSRVGVLRQEAVEGRQRERVGLDLGARAVLRAKGVQVPSSSGWLG